MAVPDAHPIRGTAGTARGANTVRSNELLDDNAVSRCPGSGIERSAKRVPDSVTNVGCVPDVVADNLHEQVGSIRFVGKHIPNAMLDLIEPLETLELLAIG
jgi:hypothetical protein